MYASEGATDFVIGYWYGSSAYCARLSGACGHPSPRVLSCTSIRKRNVETDFKNLLPAFSTERERESGQLTQSSTLGTFHFRAHPPVRAQVCRPALLGCVHRCMAQPVLLFFARWAATLSGKEFFFGALQPTLLVRLATG